MKDQGSIGIKDKIGYGVGNLGYGLVTQTITTFLVFYVTVILGLPGSLIGLIVAISIIWDAVSDPIMGYISDNTVSKYGRRHIYILIGTITTAFMNVMLWNVYPNINIWLKFWWILVAVLLLKTFITIFVTPYSALGAELSKDYDERSMIQAIKTIFYLLGFLLVSAGSMFIFFRPTTAYPVGQMNPSAYANIALVSSVIMLVAGLITYHTTKKYLPRLPIASKSTEGFSGLDFVSKIKFSLKDLDYRAIFFGYLFTNMASGIISVIGMHTFTYTFELDNYKIGMVLGTQFIVSIIAQPIRAKISSRIDKNNAVKLGLKISILGCLTLFFMVLIREQVIVNYGLLLIYSVIIGFGTSGLFSLPLSMIADTVDQEELCTGERNEGVYYGMLNFGYKISQSVAILLLGVMLDVIKFKASNAVQSDYTLFFLGTFLSLGSLVAFLLALNSYRSYSLDKTKVAFIQQKIDERNDELE